MRTATETWFVHAANISAMSDTPNQSDVEVYEIRDPNLARQHVLQGLHLSRSGPLNVARVEAALALAVEIISEGAPLPPLGFLADLAHVASGSLRSADLASLEALEGIDAATIGRYEDFVLGKLYADLSFESASDAVQRYSGRDRFRALAFLVNQVRVRCRFGGAMISPGVIKGLQKAGADQTIEDAWQCIHETQWSQDLLEDLSDLIKAVRNTGQLLGGEDVFELESGTALADFGQRVALRQVLRTAEALRLDLPRHKPTPRPKRYSVATNIMEEDHYPIGGFTSISNKGTVESLLRSELAYIDDDMRPDLFDIKFARDELLYYSRDENQFLRRRLTYTFVLYPDLTSARLKDQSLPYQRIVLLLAFIYTTVKQLIEWMTADAIKFEVLFVTRGTPSPLVEERDLLETLLGDEIKSDIVTIADADADAITERCRSGALASLSQTLSISVETVAKSDDLSLASRLLINRAEPTLFDHDDSEIASELTSIEAWKEQLSALLSRWI